MFAMNEYLHDNKPGRPLCKAEQTIKPLVEQQLNALGCDKYRITIIPVDENQKPYLPGKRKDKEEKFYTREEVVDLIPMLRYENNKGKHICITPMDDNAQYILIDDCRLSTDDVDGIGLDLEKTGIKPCLVQKSSWASTQVILKVPKALERDDVNKHFVALNREYGDQKISGLRHGFRLAGFKNVKPKHLKNGQYPFVEIVSAVNRFCTTTARKIAELYQPKTEYFRKVPAKWTPAMRADAEKIFTREKICCRVPQSESVEIWGMRMWNQWVDSDNKKADLDKDRSACFRPK